MLFRRICRSVVRRDQISLNGFPSPPSDSGLFDEAADGSLTSCDAKTPGRKRDPSSRRTLRGRASREGIEQRQSGLSCSASCFCASPGGRCHRHRTLATLGAIRAQTQSRLDQATVAARPVSVGVDRRNGVDCLASGRAARGFGVDQDSIGCVPVCWAPTTGSFPQPASWSELRQRRWHEADPDRGNRRVGRRGCVDGVGRV